MALLFAAGIPGQPAPGFVRLKIGVADVKDHQLIVYIEQMGDAPVQEPIDLFFVLIQLVPRLIELLVGDGMILPITGPQFAVHGQDLGGLMSGDAKQGPGGYGQKRPAGLLPAHAQRAKTVLQPQLLQDLNAQMLPAKAFYLAHLQPTQINVVVLGLIRWGRQGYLIYRLFPKNPSLTRLNGNPQQKFSQFLDFWAKLG